MRPNVAAALFAVFSLLFVVIGLRGRSADQRVAHAAPSSKAGILLQGAAFAAVFMLRPRGSRLFDGGWFVSPSILGAIGIVLALSAALISLWAQRTLGRQWSVSARVLHGHRLITSGPYAYVRHPIYAGLFLLLMAGGLAVTSPAVLALAAGLYLAGFAVRVRAEEQLMRDTFGDEWETYRRRVPAMLPFLHWG